MIQRTKRVPAKLKVLAVKCAQCPAIKTPTVAGVNTFDHWFCSHICVEEFRKEVILHEVKEPLGLKKMKEPSVPIARCKICWKLKTAVLLGKFFRSMWFCSDECVDDYKIIHNLKSED